MKERIKKKTVRGRNKSTKRRESKNNRNDRGTNAKPRCSRGVLSNVELDLTWRAHVKTNRYTHTHSLLELVIETERVCEKERTSMEFPMKNLVNSIFSVRRVKTIRSISPERIYAGNNDNSYTVQFVR